MEDFQSFYSANGIIYGVTAKGANVPILAVIAGSPVSGHEIIACLKLGLSRIKVWLKL